MAHRTSCQRSRFSRPYLIRAQHVIFNVNNNLDLSANAFPSAARLGLALHCLGLTKEKQGLFEESYDAYQCALTNYRDVFGPNDFRVANMYLKYAEHHGRKARVEQDADAKQAR